MKRHLVHLCGKCGAQQWFAGSCPEPGCYGRVRSFQAILVSDIQEFGTEMADSSSPVPAWFIRNFVDRLLKLTKQ